MSTLAPIFVTKNINETKETYLAIGMELTLDLSHYLIFRKDSLEIHFSTFADLNPYENTSAAYLRLENSEEVQDWWKRFQKIGWEMEGLPRVSRPNSQPWGMEEFHIVDTMGNLLRVGCQSPSA